MTCVDIYGKNSGGSVVPFKSGKVTNGIRTTGVGKIKQTGTFTCETADLYLILAFIMTNKNEAVTGMYRNSNLIAYGYFSVNGHYQTTTVVALEHLYVNDSISTKAVGTISIYGVCLSVVQITM
jgi:hypothetical protein